MAYASKTKVPIDRTRAQIEQLVRRYGADQFFSGWDADKAFVSFRARNRFVRFCLPLPKRKGVEVTKWERLCRALWRALLLTIKAKLESTEAEIETFEQAFLAHLVLPDQTLVGDRIIGAITESYHTGKMPQLPAVGESES